MARKLYDEFKRNNLRTTVVPEGMGDKSNEVVTVKDITAENLPELEKSGI